MAAQPFTGFRHFPTHHCVTGSMRHLYAYSACDISEEMLLGLGAGVSFSYWHFRGQLPFTGGRGGFRPPLEETTAARTGEAPDPASRLGECTELLLSLADLEDAAWRRLGQKGGDTG